MSRDGREHQGLFVLFEALAQALGAADPAEVSRQALERMGDADLEAVVMIDVVDWVKATTEHDNDTGTKGEGL